MMMMMMMMIGQGMEGNCPRVWAKPHPRILLPPALWPPWPGARPGLIIIIIIIIFIIMVVIIIIFIIIIIIIAS